ncbi:sensor histidine kinase [Listeria booriae]|uniref:hypothetical protein n=1 Tax=Listeria booriae TaxID=1552123 RepID=UPI0016268D27|nr:hypothetical protein [Listeria booriae]MBC2327985.1 hypothetical protein [Listeria booriae]
MLTFAFGFVVVGVCQMFLLVFCANILARKALSALAAVLVGIVLAVIGLILLAKIQYFSMVFVIVILICIFRFKKIGWATAIVSPILAMLAMIMSDYLIIFTMNLLNKNYEDFLLNHSILYVLILIPLTFGFSFVINRFVPKIRENYLLVVLLVLTIILFYIFIYAGSLYNFPNAITSIYTLIFATFILAIALTFVIVTKISQKQLEIKKQQLELAQLEEYTTRMESLYASMNMFRHDYINILASLHGYIAQGDKTILESYFKETIAPLKNTFEAAEGEE